MMAVLIDAAGQMMETQISIVGAGAVNMPIGGGGIVRFERLAALPDGRAVFTVKDNLPPFVVHTVDQVFALNRAPWPQAWQQCVRNVSAIVGQQAWGGGVTLVHHQMTLQLKPGPHQFQYALRTWAVFRQVDIRSQN